jgi:hypothetical protein
MANEPVNPYTKKAEFHYAPLPVQIVMALEDAGFCHVCDGVNTPTNAECFFEPSLGRPFGLTDAGVYMIAFATLIYALFTVFLK